MENELKVLLGSGIVIILTDYFKMIGEETSKNRTLISNIIKSSLISLGFIITLAFIDFYHFNPHLYRVFSEQDLNIYTIVFIAGTLILMILNSIFNWISRLVRKILYFFGRGDLNLKKWYYVAHIITCFVLVVSFKNLTTRNKYKIFKQDVIVQDNTGKEYLLKENTTFDFYYEDNPSKIYEHAKSYFETKDSTFKLTKNSKIKVLRESKIFPTKGGKLIYILNKNRINGSTVFSTSDSIITLKEDDTFILKEDAKIALSQINTYKDIIEAQFYLIAIFYLVIKFICLIYISILSYLRGENKTSDDEWKLSENIKIFTSDSMNEENVYDDNSYLQDEDNYYSDSNESVDLKCEIGDIIINSANYEATIVSEASVGKTMLSKDYILIKLNDKKVSGEFLFFIIKNFLSKLADKKLTQNDLKDELLKLKIKLPWKIYQDMVGHEYKVCLQKKTKLEKFYKEIIE